MKVWIVGKKGLLARAVTHACRARGLDFVATSREEVDVTELESLKKMEGLGITHIVNTSAMANVDLAESNPQEAFCLNEVGPRNLGSLATLWRAPLTHISTDYVFDGLKSAPYLETDKCNPISVYGMSKLAGEKALPSACILRTSWLFGEGGRHFMSMILEKMKSEKILYAVSDQTSRPTFAPDLAEAILDTLGQEGLYHFANHGEESRLSAAQKIREIALERGIKLLCEEILPIPLAATNRPKYSCLDTHKIETILPKPPRRWEEAFKEWLE